MSGIFIASNFISITGPLGYGHLQIVSDVAGSLEEIEVQAPINEFWDEMGNFGYPSIRDHVLEEHTQFALGNDSYDPNRYALVSADIGNRDAGDVWDLLTQIHEYFESNSFNFSYGLWQNSNSYAATLLWMVGIDVGEYIDDLTVGDIDSFPGPSTNIVTSPILGPTVNFVLSGADGADVLQTGDGDDSFVAGSGDDQYDAGGGNDTLIGDQGADILLGGGGTDTADYSGTVEGADSSGTRGVIPPFLAGCIRRIHAAIFSFWAGVMPPMPMFGRSLL